MSLYKDKDFYDIMREIPENTEKTFVESFFNLLFSIDSNEMFDKMAIAAFHYQYRNNFIYRKYLELIKFKPSIVEKSCNIPFLPIEFFKNHKIITGNNAVKKVFKSSGTTGSIQSLHFVSDITIYEKNYLRTFEYFYGPVEEYCVLALLPSYLEREGSSLVYMVSGLIEKSRSPYSGFFLNNTTELISRIKFLQEQKKKILLMGVSYALLDLIEKEKLSLTQGIVMETGGMKGRRKELVKDELHRILCEGFSVKQIHAEYGMTELLTQAYSKGHGIYHGPPWMKVMIRDIYAPSYLLGENVTGGINIIDLANINSCCFIETQDLGRITKDNAFEVLGRMDNSDIRGCNLLIQ